MFTLSPQSFAATPGLTMGTSSTYGVLASTGVTSSNPSNISGSAGGDVGVGGATAPTGTITLSGSQILGGASLTALSDANTAFSDTRVSVALPVELGSTTLTSGAYSGGTFGMNGTLTLDGLGDPTSVFIFNTTTTLITAASSQVVLINGAQACNVFWQIGSSATLGASSTMIGHIIAAVSIGTGTTTTIDGQLIALTGAVTLGGSSVVNDACAIPSHTVTFDGNTSDGGSTAVQTTNIAAALTSNGFTKSGYTFNGWNTVAGGGGVSYPNSGTYSFTSDLILYAQWTLIPPVVHTVTFVGNGFDGGTTAPQTTSTSTALTLNGFTRVGYTFAGWNTVPTGIAGTAYSDGTSYNFAADLTLYAQWIVIPPALHTVTFLGNGFDAGATAPETNSVAAVLTSNGFTRTGYTFAGWNTAINGSGATYADGATYGFTSDLSLFAHWVAIAIPPIVAVPPIIPILPVSPTPQPPPQSTPLGTIPPVAAPVAAPVTGTLQIIKVVENRFHGTAVPSDFVITIIKTGSNAQFSPVRGTGGLGVTINLAPGSYDLSETPTSGYRGVWSGEITAGGRVLVIANQNVFVTRTNFDMASGNPRVTPPPLLTPPTVVSVPPKTDPPPATTLRHTVTGGALPRTASGWADLCAFGLILMLIAISGLACESLLIRE